MSREKKRTEVPMVDVVVAADTALRHARHLLENLSTTLLGAFATPPTGSPMTEVLAELRAAEATCREAMLTHIHKPPEAP